MIHESGPTRGHSWMKIVDNCKFMLRTKLQKMFRDVENFKAKLWIQIDHSDIIPRALLIENVLYGMKTIL